MTFERAKLKIILKRVRPRALENLLNSRSATARLHRRLSFAAWRCLAVFAVLLLASLQAREALKNDLILMLIG